MIKRQYIRHYAIYSPLIREVIGVCTDDGKADVMSEEPNCELRRINKKEFDRFGEDDIRLNPKTGNAEVWSNGKLIGAQG